MKSSECLPLVFLLSALLFHILAVLSVSVLRLAVVVERYDRPLWPVISFIMKKFIILFLTIIIFLYSSLPSFAISRFDSYAYWASADNIFRYIGHDVIDTFHYSKNRGLYPPSDIQSDFYTNGYYSNNVALFSQYTNATAPADLSALESYVDWTFTGIDGPTPADAGLILPSNYGSMSEDGYRVFLDGYRYSRPAVSYSNYDVETVLVYETTFSIQDFSYNWNWNPLRFELTYETESGYRLCSCDIGSLNHTDFFLMLPTNGDQVYWDDKASFNSARLSTAQIYEDTTYNFKMVVYQDNTVSYYLNDVLQGSYISWEVNPDNNNPYKPRTKVIVTANEVLFTHFSIKREVVPTSTVTANLGRPVTIPSGDNLEFYVNLKRGSVSNVTQQTTTDFDFSRIINVSVMLDSQVSFIPVVYIDDWLYISVPAQNTERTFSACSFSFTTPFVSMNTGDQLRYEMEVAFSDLVFGNLDDIGFNPDVDPGEDQFRDDVISGIGDINDSLDSIHDVLTTPPDLDEFNSVMDSVNGIFDEFDRYVFDKYPNFPPIPEAPAPDFVTRLWLIVDEVLYIGIPLQSRNLGWLTFNSDDNVFRLSHFIVWFTTIFLTRAFIYAISEATKAKNNPIQGDGDD